MMLQLPTKRIAETFFDELERAWWAEFVRLVYAKLPQSSFRLVSSKRPAECVQYWAEQSRLARRREDEGIRVELGVGVVNAVRLGLVPEAVREPMNPFGLRPARVVYEPRPEGAPPEVPAWEEGVGLAP